MGTRPGGVCGPARWKTSCAKCSMDVACSEFILVCGQIGKQGRLQMSKLPSVRIRIPPGRIGLRGSAVAAPGNSAFEAAGFGRVQEASHWQMPDCCTHLISSLHGKTKVCENPEGATHSSPARAAESCRGNTVIRSARIVRQPSVRDCANEGKGKARLAHRPVARINYGLTSFFFKAKRTSSAGLEHFALVMTRAR